MFLIRRLKHQAATLYSLAQKRQFFAPSLCYYSAGGAFHCKGHNGADDTVDYICIPTPMNSDGRSQKHKSGY